MKYPLWRPAAILVRHCSSTDSQTRPNDSPQGGFRTFFNEFVAKFTWRLPRLWSVYASRLDGESAQLACLLAPQGRNGQHRAEQKL
jgi:hypothetical protein